MGIERRHGLRSRIAAATRDRPTAAGIERPTVSPGHRSRCAVGGEYRVGDRPPDTVDVRAATVTVPSGMENVSEPAREAAKTGGTTVWRRSWPEFVDACSRRRRGTPSRGDYPADVLLATRYERMADLTGANVAVTRQSTVEMTAT